MKHLIAQTVFLNQLVDCTLGFASIGYELEEHYLFLYRCVTSNRRFSQNDRHKRSCSWPILDQYLNTAAEKMCVVLRWTVATVPLKVTGVEPECL